MVEESELVRTLRNHKGLNDLQMWRMQDEAANRIAALEAQLAERVKVKPLEWAYDSHTSQWWANSAIGQYRVWEIHGHAFFNIGSSPSHAGGKSIEEAKAAAQADYERRILSALEATPPAPKVTDAWQVKDYADGWIDFATAEEALAEVRVMGSALIRPTLTAAQDEED